MLVEPDLDRAVLTAALERHYGLAVSAVRFIPAGETAWCYRVTDERGRRWFLKLGRPGAIEPVRAEFALQLAGALADQGVPVPRPRPTRAGELWCWLEGLRVVVFEFIDGQPLSDQDLRVPRVARRRRYGLGSRGAVGSRRTAEGWEQACEQPDEHRLRSGWARWTCWPSRPCGRGGASAW
jgi:Ser/Thr protein kinase RdoA (MazF antagonist)